MNAIFVPSGDHAAHLSWAPDEWVRFRVGPFSIGAVKMSPLAVNSARSPLGERSYSSIWPAAETREGRFQRPSSGTVIAIGVLFPLFTSSTWSSPFSSYTIRPWWSLLGQRTSHVVPVVTGVVFAVATS